MCWRFIKRVTDLGGGFFLWGDGCTAWACGLRTQKRFDFAIIE